MAAVRHSSEFSGSRLREPIITTSVEVSGHEPPVRGAAIE
jgi:hypothetical protein